MTKVSGTFLESKLPRRTCRPSSGLRAAGWQEQGHLEAKATAAVPAAAGNPVVSCSHQQWGIWGTMAPSSTTLPRLGSSGRGAPSRDEAELLVHVPRLRLFLPRGYTMRLFQLGTDPRLTGWSQLKVWVPSMGLHSYGTR